LAAAAGNPQYTANELVLSLAQDHGLPADIRIAIARKASLFDASRSMHDRAGALNGKGSKVRNIPGPDRQRERGLTPAKAGLTPDLLFSIARDTAAKAADRRKAASQIAELFLPKHKRGKKPNRRKFPSDECGFAVDPELASELRDCKIKLSCLTREQNVRPTRLREWQESFTNG
jgi:hypothetical protein